jgi:D-alanyl-D-alanine carboxypeptidase
MESEASEALEKLFQGAERDNINFYCVSGYRSYDHQKTIYKNKVRAAGKEEADKYVAQPGHSEHQTGLAMDLTNRDGINNELTGDFGRTEEGMWLKNNAYRYGFIIRYPRGKENITGYSYEPWHIRYVGEKAAKKIRNNNVVLEEYIQNYDGAVADGKM